MLGLVCSPASAAKAPKASATTSTVIFRVEYQGTGKFHRQSESKQSYQFCGPTTLDETDSTTFTWHLIWHVRMHPRAAADAVVVIGQPSGTFAGVADVTVSEKSPVDLDNTANGCHSSDAACHGSARFGAQTFVVKSTDTDINVPAPGAGFDCSFTSPFNQTTCSVGQEWNGQLVFTKVAAIPVVKATP